MLYFLISYIIFFSEYLFSVDEKKEVQIGGLETKRIIDSRSNDVYRAERVNGKYFDFLKKLLSEAEKNGGPSLSPSHFRNIAIKIKTEQAPGLYVSKKLLNSLLDILSSRGYDTNNIFIVDRDLDSLKKAGFYSSGIENGFYRNCRIYSSSNGDYFNSKWFHDSPMPPTIHDRSRFYLAYPDSRSKRIEEERKSYLPCILFLEDTFWINLAVANDHVNLGIDGASSNITTGAISNYQRFLEKPTLAPAAVTEILAIPEIWEKRIYSILDLSHYQFANGGKFDAEFLGSQSTLLLSENPISVDYIALDVLRDIRKKNGFIERNAVSLPLFKYAKELGLVDIKKVQTFNVY